MPSLVVIRIGPQAPTDALSFTAALAANGTFTSSWTPSRGFARIVATAFADQAGTLYVEQSNDNTNADVSSSWAVSASTGLPVSVEVIGQFYRLRYVNGGNAQGTFRLYCNTREV